VDTAWGELEEGNDEPLSRIFVLIIMNDHPTLTSCSFHPFLTTIRSFHAAMLPTTVFVIVIIVH
jgi:hypothetical protein